MITTIFCVSESSIQNAETAGGESLNMENNCKYAVADRREGDGSNLWQKSKDLSL